ncbi:hypothetical protein CPB84DRAFT_1788268, partial [Gymnopilus junonius]
MLVLSKGLTTGQITFIFRVVIQALSYVDVFLLGLLVLGNAPRVAPLDTHDVLNRVVGKSTSTPTALKQDFFFPLGFTLALSICFGLFVSLSDIGLIGLRACTVPGSDFQDFPASNPHTVPFYLCDAAHDVSIDSGVDERICMAWHNSTFGDESVFRTTVLHPTIQSGIAVLPHETGVKMIVGVPQLSKQQKVNIPKTLTLEVEIGCMPLGTLGGTDYFIPDSKYLAERMGQYTGPEMAFRAYILPYFNTSASDASGYYSSYNGSAGQFGWQTEMTMWYPPGLNLSAAANEVSQNITSIPPKSLKPIPAACAFYSNTDLHLTRASFFEVIHNVPNKGDTTYANYDVLTRFTLSDNTNDRRSITFTKKVHLPDIRLIYFRRRSIGPVFTQIGSAMLSFSALDIPSLGLINTDYFGANYRRISSDKMGSGLGASFLLTSTGYNGW